MDNSILQGLNSSQREAVVTTEGYIRVIAGAGSGKTRALTHRYAYLTGICGISPSNILCVTFTNKAAAVMKLRIRSLVGELANAYVCTFHGFCLHMLKDCIHVLSWPKSFIVLDVEDQKSIVRGVLGTIGNRSLSVKQALRLIERRKRSSDYIQMLFDSYELPISSTEDEVFAKYISEQKCLYGLDFTDLIACALYVLRTNDNVRSKWQHTFQYIMVDEFQNVSDGQFALASILSDYHRNLFVVGDPDQAIYAWRGAAPDYILNFDKRFENVKTIFMSENYRSSHEIIGASNDIISHNKNRIPRNLIPMRQEHRLPFYFHASNQSAEANFVASQIKSLCDMGVNPNQIAILYRAHYVSRPFEEVLMREGIPYVLFNGVAFYSRTEVKDCLSYLRLVNSLDDLSLLRVINTPRRGIGSKTIKLLTQTAKEKNMTLWETIKACDDISISSKTWSNIKTFVEQIESFRSKANLLTPSELLQTILKETGYEDLLSGAGEDDRLDNIAELKQSAADYEATFDGECTLSDYLEHVALFTSADTREKTL